MTDDRDERGCFAEGNEGAVKHGVAAAIKDLAAGRPLRGNLAAIQHRYAEQVATHQGRVDAQRWLAGAFFAIVEGLLAVVQNAIEQGEQEKAVAYIVNFGTFGSKAGAELERLATMDTEASGSITYEQWEKALKDAGKL